MQSILAYVQTFLPPVSWFIQLLLALLLIAVLGLLLGKPVMRYVINRVVDDASAKILSDEYDENVAELLPSLKRFSVINIIELSLRAETGKVITRPLGTPKHYPEFDNLLFSPQQMTRFTLPVSTNIDMAVTLGCNAKKPLKLKIPLIIGSMAYGLALSEEAKVALATASNRLGTALGSGEGPFLPEEADAAGKFILQICRWSWGLRTNEQIAAADMLEIAMGQGADVGTAPIIAADIEGRARELGGLAPDETAISLPAPPGVHSPADWPVFMKKLRQRAEGKPIALKLMATDRLEEELAVAVSLGVDVICLDGAGGGSHAVAPIKQDDFSIPILYALVRAKRYLAGTQISLMVGGGLHTPGHCLKALALGADAVVLGTVPLFALVHNQATKAIPWEPPTALVYYNSQTKDKFDLCQGATSVTNVFNSMVLEMEEAMRALGKSSLNQLTPDDLVALDSLTADLTGVKKVTDTCTPRPPSSIGRTTLHGQPNRFAERQQYTALLNQMRQSIQQAKKTAACLESMRERLRSYLE